MTLQFAPNPIWICFYVRKILFSFLSVYYVFLPDFFAKALSAGGRQIQPVCLRPDEPHLPHHYHVRPRHPLPRQPHPAAGAGA